MTALILPLIMEALKLTNTIFEGSNDKNKKKHAVRAAEIEVLLGKEQQKPMEEWIHSDIELWMIEAKSIISLANTEVMAYANK